MLFCLLTLVDTEEDQDRFEEIYHTYKNQLAAIARRQLGSYASMWTEDVVQTVFMSIARNMNTVRSLSERALKAYIYTAVQNAVCDIMRKESVHGYMEDVDDEKVQSIASDDCDILTALCEKEDCERIVACIQELPPLYTGIMSMALLEEMRLVTIAKLLDIRYDTVKKRYSRGISMLRGALEHEKKRTGSKK